MNQRRTLPVLLLCAIAILPFLSCHKIIDIIRNHPGGDGDSGNNDTTTCQVTQVTSTGHADSLDWVLSITYDQWRNPVKAFQNIGNDTFVMYFRYNDQHLLTDYILTDAENRYHEWHTYAYEGQKIIRDTIYSTEPTADDCHCMIDTINNPKYYNGYFGLYVYDISYDSQDRVIADSVRYLVYPIDYNPSDLEYTHNYTYDSSGNLILSMFNPKPYDDKVSIFRTNKVWMFLNRNYSVNNSRPAAEYNTAGLPVKFTGVNGDGSQTSSFMGTSLFNATIDYDCRQ